MAHGAGGADVHDADDSSVVTIAPRIFRLTYLIRNMCHPLT